MKKIYANKTKTVTVYHLEKHRLNNDHEGSHCFIFIIKDFSYQLDKTYYYEFINNPILQDRIWQALTALEFRKLKEKIYSIVGL